MEKQSIRSRTTARLKRIAIKVLGPPLDRVVMDEQTKMLIERIDFSNLSALEISGKKWKDFGFRSYRFLDYPEFDIAGDVAFTSTFDLIIAEQVFEHVAYPYKAGRNVYQFLNPGGYFLITTPFLQKVHYYPIDCCRWTEMGLTYFLCECGFQQSGIITGSWGEQACRKGKPKISNTVSAQTSLPLFAQKRSDFPSPSMGPRPESIDGMKRLGSRLTW